jgi:hypothetical protein
MGIFDITYSLQAERIISPSKRTTNTLLWLASCLNPLQWISDKSVLNSRVGYIVETALPYTCSLLQITDATPIITGGLRFTKKGEVYEALIDSPSLDTKNLNEWSLYASSIFGYEKIVSLNGTKGSLEYILNLQIVGSLTNAYENVSDNDIYITNNSTINGNFMVGLNSPRTTFVGLVPNKWVAIDNVLNANYDFTVNVLNTLGSPTELTPIITAIVDKYKVYGTSYEIVYY